MRRTSETGTISSAEDADSPRTFRTLKSLHRITSISDVPVVTLRHARVGFLLRPMRCPSAVARPCGPEDRWELT